MAGYSDEPDKLLPSPGPVTLPRQPAAGLAAGLGGHHAIVLMPALRLAKCHPRHPCREAWQEPGYPGWVRRHPRVLFVLTVGAGGCALPCFSTTAANSSFCALPATVGENLQLSLESTTETLQKPAACRNPCSPRCPRSHRSPPHHPGLPQAGSCTQSQSAPRQLSLPPGSTRAAMPRLSRFSRAGEGGWGAPGQPHGISCWWGLRGHAKGRGDRPQPCSQ